ncbi:hypothetical protein [Vibrio campbellii]|uniref:hypothetical protein n=1 Tax=Vibrio campbellii TaxID=680 RepID=UPI00210ED147|nr:hypothetical protein [Vibrio campbellii]UTZ44199.1 hypothetical protein HB764_23580 [Vibrio campbellii]
MKNSYSISYLLDELGDPLSMVPMTGPAASLREGLILAFEEFERHMGECGVARRYWTVPCELCYEEIGNTIGNAFTLAQVPISQAVSIFIKLRESCNDINRYPSKKASILRYRSEINETNDLTKIEIIDVVANYYKHRHEWPDDWDETKAKGVQKSTIQMAKKMGMTNSDMTANMKYALSLLGIHNKDLTELCRIVDEWREDLAKAFHLDLHVGGQVPILMDI